MALLTYNEIQALTTALAPISQLLEGRRPFLVQGIDQRYLGMRLANNPTIVQLSMDVTDMSNQERLTTGEIPLEIYLRNLALLLTGTKEQNVVLTLLDRISHLSNGAPVVVPTTRERQQQIIHRDDTVAKAFVDRAMRAGAAVVKLLVKSYGNGEPRKQNGDDMIFMGTGWFVTPGLIMTNHHVINARKEGENPAKEVDFRLQAQNAVAQLDYDDKDMQPTEIAIIDVEAWDSTLDYALVRVQPTTRQPLSLSITPFTLGNEPVPVNIIQHPNGRPKRYGIRNNLVHTADANEIRYFTDTDSGSSGSPVATDDWRVVGLHRGSSFVEGVKFQGKATAYVNIGTPILAIINDLKVRYPTLATEFGV